MNVISFWCRGMEEVSAETASDRSVVVLPPLNGWITIYDEATESQDTDALARLATKTEKALERLYQKM